MREEGSIAGLVITVTEYFFINVESSVAAGIIPWYKHKLI